MSEFAMITGILHAPPITKVTKSGHAVRFFKIKIPRCQSNEWWMCSAFSETASAELEQFSPGDCVCVVGALNLALYTFDGKIKINREISVSRLIGIKTPDKMRRKAETTEIQSSDIGESDDAGGLPAWIAAPPK